MIVIARGSHVVVRDEESSYALRGLRFALDDYHAHQEEG